MTSRLRLREVNHVEPEKTKGAAGAEAVVEGAQALGGSEDRCGRRLRARGRGAPGDGR